jgi:hypothetical protein
MSVVIPDMEMPKSCYSEDEFCPFHTFVFDLNGGKNICTQLEKTASRDKRLEDCPLIELPSHGRLVDKDAILKRAEELVANNYADVPTIGLSIAFGLAPTVLEASKGE